MNSRGIFSFQSNGQKIDGKICTWSLNRFCEKMNIPNVTEMFSAITTGISIRAIAEILLCGVEYNYRGKDFPFTIDIAMDWIDDIGGISQTVNIIEKSLSDNDQPTSKKKAKSRSHGES